MVTNSVLRLFLILSIVTIVAGILLIVFNQFDRGYVFVGDEADFQAQQKNLINHVYETQVKARETADSPLLMKLKRATVVMQSEAEEAAVNQVNADDAAIVPSPAIPTPRISQPAATQRQGVFSTNPWEPYNDRPVDYQARLLHNNPWSPYYKPGY